MRRHLPAVTLAAGMLFAGAFLTFYLYQNVRAQVLSQFNASQLLLAQQAAERIETYFTACTSDVRYLASRASVRRFSAKSMPADVQAMFTRLESAYASRVVVLDAGGAVVYATSGEAAEAVRPESDIEAWARRPANRGTVRFVVARPERAVTASAGERLDQSTPHPFLVAPLYQDTGAGGADAGGIYTGMLVVSIDLRRLAEGTLGPAPAGDQPAQRIWIMDADGTLLLQSEHPEMVLKSIWGATEECRRCHASFDYAEQMLISQQGTVDYQLRGGQSKVAAFAPMSFGGASWVVVVNAPKDEVTGFMWTTSLETVGLFGVLGIVVGVTFLSVSKNARQEIVLREKAKHLQEEERLVEKLRDSHESQKTLNALLQLALQDMTLAELLQQALVLVLRSPWPVTLGAGTVFLTDGKTGGLLLEAHSGVDGEIVERCARVPMGHCVCGRVAASGRALHCIDMDERHETTYADIRPHGHYVIPIAAGETVLGVLNVYLASGHAHDAAEEEFLGSFASTLAGIIVRKRAEESLREADERLREQETLVTLGEMAAVVAHEVRNPLAGVRGAIQIIGRRLPPGGKDATVIGEIVARIDALNELMKDLLLFSRPPQVRPSPVDIMVLAKETSALVSQDPKAHDVRFELEGSAPVVMVDPQLLQIVLLNLFLNAADAMHGTGTIRLLAAVSDGVCRIVVADTGPGIPPDIRDRIFTPFFTTKPRGTGLGLSTAKRLVDIHHGRVSVECPPAGGTVVTIELPLEQPAARARTSA